MRSAPIPPEIMDFPGYDFEDDFSALIHECKVPDSVQQVLNDRHLISIALFAFAFVDSEKLEEFISTLGTLHDDPPNWSTSVEASSIRHLHHCCVSTTKRERDHRPAETSHNGSSSSHMGSLLDLAWADLPPIRVKEVDFLAMKKEFHNKYPSESLSSSNTPCARLIATLMQQKTRKAFTWIPWKELLSESRWLDIQEKGKKRQKLEGIILYDAIADIDDDELAGAPFFIQSILETRAIALALTKICHLSVGKKYLTSFMKLYTARSLDSGLRPPSLKEAQSAESESESEVRMPKRQPSLGREPGQKLRNYEQSVKRARLFCTKFHELIRRFHPPVSICSHLLPIIPTLYSRELFEFASPLQLGEASKKKLIGIKKKLIGIKKKINKDQKK